ncbi:zinc-dependent alcohol dehydrogenase family protein [Actinomadura rudentiformis]|uniref:Probable alcohol dehydrogenase AdhA n=1 Tax=Actinomadura rudentiformis TaxID=359158 RepID=A0A6H9YI08_9ACTN|nr:zinc-dependent alcohol dehydrogenase family protein [Actinomadura rudentiformis]KAB2342076.1 zinc-dependent alcohol dehydrogenase family protein [Actinomadura rudentiformis]
MRAWMVDKPGPIDDGPLRRIDRDMPEPGQGELLLKVLACGVCRTDLHVAEGDLPVHLPGVTPGHEIVGEVVAVGAGCRRSVGERVGVAWLRGTCGACRFCRRGAENLCPASVYTGWDAHGGYAEYAIAVDAYAYALPPELDDVRAAPLLCAGIIGYRALRRAELPPGGRLGIWGFGGSAHLAAQIARAEGAAVHVFTRSPAARELALSLGAVWAGDSFGEAPGPLDSAIIFAPAGGLVPAALERLDRGGTLAIAGIHLTDVPPLDYQRHLFRERQVRSVTANTRADGEEFLALAARLGVAVTTRPYGLDEADQALADLAADRFTGAAVLVP